MGPQEDPEMNVMMISAAFIDCPFIHTDHLSAWIDNFEPKKDLEKFEFRNYL